MLVAAAAVLLQVLFCITLARFVTTSLARLLRSRRGKDLAAFLLLPVFALYQVITQVVPRMAFEGSCGRSASHGLDRWLRWLPPGLAAHAVQYASAGRRRRGAAVLLLLAVIIVALGWLWIGILRRALVTVDTSTQSSAVRQGALPFARFGLRGTVAARFWIYQRREPSSLIYWGIVGVVMIASSVSGLLTPSYRGALLSSAGIGAALLAIFHSNSAGMTGPAFVYEAMAMTSRRALRCYFSGQNLALCLIAVPLLSVISFSLAAVAGHPAAGFIAVAVDFAGIGASMALSNIFTARLPYPTEKREGSPVRGAAEGNAARALWATLGSLLGTAVAVSPVAAAEVLTSTDPAAVRMPVLLACAACYGLALAWAGVRIAARMAEPGTAGTVPGSPAQQGVASASPGGRPPGTPAGLRPLRLRRGGLVLPAQGRLGNRAGHVTGWSGDSVRAGARAGRARTGGRGRGAGRSGPHPDGPGRDGPAAGAGHGRARHRGHGLDGAAAAVVPRPARGEPLLDRPGRPGRHRRLRGLGEAPAAAPGGGR